LTWRDLHHIVAHASQNNESVAKQGGWFTNGAGFRGNFFALSLLFLFTSNESYKN